MVKFYKGFNGLTVIITVLERLCSSLLPLWNREENPRWGEQASRYRWSWSWSSLWCHCSGSGLSRGLVHPWCCLQQLSRIAVGHRSCTLFASQNYHSEIRPWTHFPASSSSSVSWPTKEWLSPSGTPACTAVQADSESTGWNYYQGCSIEFGVDQSCRCSLT